MVESLKELTHIKCPKCNREHYTKSKRFFTSCPNCKHTINIKNNLVNGGK